MVYALSMENTSNPTSAPEELKPQSRPSTADSRKKRWIGIAIGACASFAFVSYGFMSYQKVLTNADMYIYLHGIHGAAELLEGYRDLGAVQVTGLRGFSAALGKNQAMETAKKLAEAEVALYSEVTSPLSYILVNGEVKRCISQLNREKMRRVKTLQKLAGPGFIQTQMLMEAIEDLDKNSQPSCLEKFRDNYGSKRRFDLPPSQ